jgi:hypothetical protein
MPNLPPKFDGPRFVTKPIPGDWRLALRVDSMTVFNGGVVYVRAVHGPAFPNGGAWAPQVVELDVPEGLRIVVPAGAGTTGGVVSPSTASPLLGRYMTQCVRVAAVIDSGVCVMCLCMLCAG